MSSEIQIVAVF